MMRFIIRTAARAAEFAARLPFGRPRQAPLGRGGAAAIVALGLALNGLGLCLCVAPSPKAADPHACCPSSTGHHQGHASTRNSIQASSSRCCAPHVAPTVMARVDDRDAFRHTMIPAAAPGRSPAVPIVLPTIGLPAQSSTLRSPSPPSPPILRI